RGHGPRRRFLRDPEMPNDNLPALMQQMAALRDALDVRMCLAGVEIHLTARPLALGQPIGGVPLPGRARTGTSSPAPSAAAATGPGRNGTGGTGTGQVCFSGIMWRSGLCGAGPVTQRKTLDARAGPCLGARAL